MHKHRYTCMHTNNQHTYTVLRRLVHRGKEPVMLYVYHINQLFDHIWRLMSNESRLNGAQLSVSS